MCQFQKDLQFEFSLAFSIYHIWLFSTEISLSLTFIIRRWQYELYFWNKKNKLINNLNDSETSPSTYLRLKQKLFALSHLEISVQITSLLLYWIYLYILIKKSKNRNIIANFMIFILNRSVNVNCWFFLIQLFTKPLL